MTTTERAILKTLAYSDIFSFPLTKEELWHYLMSERSISRDTFETTLKQLVKQQQIVFSGTFYSLQTNKTVRRVSSVELNKKLRIAKRAAYYLSYIPSILFIGISGSVAMGKAEKEDDIDFFIITKKNTLFMTRLWIHAVLEVLNLRRKRLAADTSDKICVNLLIDERKVHWPKEKRDVYIAHEILHMKPLFERRGMYTVFLDKNKWVQNFFPNAFSVKQQLISTSWKRDYISLRALSFFIMNRPLEKLVRFWQKQHMKSVQTKETVSNEVLAFHPVDYRSKTLSDLNTKLKLLGLLTNK